MEMLLPVLHNVRLAVEPVAAALAAQRASTADLEVIETELYRLWTSAARHDIIEAAAADVAFHAAILQASHSPVLASVIASLETPLRKSREVTLGAYWDEAYVHKTHSDIFEAIKDRAPRAAAEAMRGHLAGVDKIIHSIKWKDLAGQGPTPARNTRASSQYTAKGRARRGDR
jgi:DNA-binding FadR family transcriptional regulator